MRELIAKDPENADQELAKVHFWWHSHAEGGVFWSGTDEETNQRGITSRYLISMVVNTSQQYRTRLTFFEPSLCWFDNLDLKWYIGPEDSISTAEAIKLADEQWKIFHRKPFFQRIFGSVLRKGTGEANTGFGSGLGTTSGGVKIPPMSNIPPPPIVPPPSVIPDPTKKEE
jgi:hypothetical protein